MMKTVLQRHVQSACGSIHSLYELLGVAGYFTMNDLQTIASELKIEQFQVKKSAAVFRFPPRPDSSLETPVLLVLCKHLLQSSMIRRLLLDQQHGWAWLRLLVYRKTSYDLSDSSYNHLDMFVQFQVQYNKLGVGCILKLENNVPWLRAEEVKYVIEKIGSTIVNWSLEGSYNVSFTKTGLSSLALLSNLLSLNLHGCDITDKDLQMLSSLPCLRDLDLGHCVNITDTGLALLSPLASLQQLELCGARITDVGVASLVKHTNMHTLILIHCHAITNASIALLAANLTYLHTLNLSECRNVTNVDSLAHLTGFHTLILTYCQGITPESLISLSSCLKGLQTLDLTDCRAVTDTTVDSMLTLDRLQKLNLDCHKALTDVGVASLVRHTNIRTLNLANCRRITDASVGVLAAKLTHLHTLNLSECPEITNVDPLADLTGLHTLELGYCKGITDASVISLSACLTSLNTLNLNNCVGITDVGLESLTHLTNLRVLDISQCPVTDVAILHYQATRVNCKLVINCS
jgi:Leucine-rich repeat (LRR) protein